MTAAICMFTLSEALFAFPAHAISNRPQLDYQILPPPPPLRYGIVLQKLPIARLTTALPHNRTATIVSSLRRTKWVMRILLPIKMLWRARYLSSI